MVIVGVKLTKPAADAARRVPSFLMSDSSDDANFAWFWCVKGKMQENHKSSQLFSLPGSRENFWQIPVAVFATFSPLLLLCKLLKQSYYYCYCEASSG